MSEFSHFLYNSSIQELMPKRPERSNKGDFGRVLCICGSVGMAGAAYFAAKAAYRVGAGLVEILTHEANLSVLQTLIPEAIVTTYGDDPDMARVEGAVARADTVVIGCGIGISTVSRKLLGAVLRSSVDKARVIDADGLNILARNPSLIKYASGSVITPHMKEMSRLNGISLEEILENTDNIAREFAKKTGAICVLKDHRTVVTDGERVYLNKSGNSGMATGGSGDVRAGIIGGLLAMKKNEKHADIMETAALGVYIHGLAGDAAAERLSEYSVMASDILDGIATVLVK